MLWVEVEAGEVVRGGPAGEVGAAERVEEVRGGDPHVGGAGVRRRQHRVRAHRRRQRRVRLHLGTTSYYPLPQPSHVEPWVIELNGIL